MTSMSMRVAGGSWSRAFRWCPLMLALALAGCGGDDGSGVDRDKALSEVTDEEVTQLCEWSTDLVSDADAIRFGCYLAALLLSSDAEQCQEVADQCIEEEEMEAEEEPADACAEVEEFPPCAGEITVGQLEDCGEAGADQLRDVAQDISCDAVPDDFADLESPAACAVIEEACPDLFEDDADVVARRLARLIAARRAGGL